MITRMHYSMYNRLSMITHMPYSMYNRISMIPHMNYSMHYRISMIEHMHYVFMRVRTLAGMHVHLDAPPTHTVIHIVYLRVCVSQMPLHVLCIIILYEFGRKYIM